MSVYSNSASSTPEEIVAYTSAVVDLLGDDEPLDVLKRTPAALTKAIAGLTPRQLAKREAPDKWSIKHVLRHLADSEIVWAWRLRLVLAEDRPPITGYDQDLWAERLEYESTNVKESLAEFGVVRKSNLRLLTRASAADLARVGVHSQRGEESVERMLDLYAGHDLLHLRQIKRIRESL